MKNSRRVISIVILCIALFISIFTLASCNRFLHKGKEIDGTVVAKDSSSITINTLDEGEYILIPEESTHNLLNDINIGDTVKAYYSGEIMESEPGQVVVNFIEVEQN